ncbi:MAG: hypothetical protein EA355_16220 [Rhodobacteraceae bacterium]|nr:MAG: hypothetical protein EA355_16220 [Paracoccaceae bacterium]
MRGVENENAVPTGIGNGAIKKPLAGLSVSTAAETGALAYRSALALGELLVDLPLPLARAIVRGMVEGVDAVRVAKGQPAGMVEAVTVEVIRPVEPDLPDFLKDRSDWRMDLMRAWSALPQEDRLAFLARATGERRAA